MTLRQKLLVAMLPLALALVAMGALSLRSTRSLGSSSQAILKDNYRSVLACQRMKESLERIDSGAVFIALGERAKGERQIAESRSRFAQELLAQEGNITEVGEREATARLRQLWGDYQRALGEVLAQGEATVLTRRYFGELEPRFLEVKRAADEILDLNQDAMVRKSEAARRSAQQTGSMLWAATILALLVGGLASSAFTSRLLRPLAVLTQAARRIGQGDLEARARVDGSDEVAALAREFNEMAAHLRQYRASSLGDLLLAQNAAQSAIDSLPDAVLIFGADGSVLSANALAERELQVGLEQSAGPLARVEPELRAVLERVKAHVLAGKGAYQPKGFEEAVRMRAADGERWILARGTPVRDEGGAVSGATVVLQDVTRLRRFDELKNDLVATVAHEFRTPLTSLRMAIHLCLEGAAGPLGPKQADLLQAGREDCERLQTMVDDLLDLSKLQSGRIELERRPVACVALLEAAVDHTRAQVAERALSVGVEDQTAGAQVLADPDRLDLVLTNLIHNAVRYSPQGGALRLRARAEGEAVRFEVADQGPGVPEPFRQRVFEKYFRVPGAPSGSAGLGLYLCKEIVQAHGGEIGVEPGPGGGSTFWFTLPPARLNPSAPLQKEGDAQL